MTAERAAASALEEHGLLLLQDATALSLATIVAGETIKGSWWAHPRAHEIFRVAELLEDIEALGGRTKTAKLVDGKVTFVHERLWPALACVGRSRDPWQMHGLDAAALALLADVATAGTTRATAATRTSGKALETRLLVDGRQVHTAQGRHETELSAWPRVNVDVADARALLEHAAAAIGAEGRLPWLARAPLA